MPLGSRTREVAKDAIITERWQDNLRQDVIEVQDRLTNVNGLYTSTTINHTGGGRGCPLHLPLTSQRIGRSIELTSTDTADTFYILALPIFIPAGSQQQHILEVDCLRRGDAVSDAVFVEVRNTSWTLTAGPTPMVTATDTGTVSGVQRLSLTLGTGWQYLLVYRRLLPGAQTLDTLVGWRLYPDYAFAGESNGLLPVTTTAGGSPYPALTTLTPTTVAQNQIGSGETQEGVGSFARPLNAFVLTRINRMIGTLWEFMTGAPVPGNSALTTTTTRDLNQANFTTEPSIDFPIACVALGSYPTTGTAKGGWLGTYGASPTQGPTQWVRYPLTQNTATTINLTYLRQWMPPFATGASSKLRCEILCAKYQAADTLTNWRFTVNEATAGNSSTVALTQIGATDYFVASITDVRFTAGAENYFTLLLTSTTTAAPLTQELIVLGFTLAFDP